jgi:hypothetical protein
MKTIKYVMSISLGLIALIFVEAILTFGNAFIISNYNLFGWVIQALLVIFTISLSTIICNNMINEGEL